MKTPPSLDPSPQGGGKLDHSMEKLQKLARIAALSFSVVFELMAGPFLGYFIGAGLVKYFNVTGLAVSIGVLVGFLASFYAAMLTIMKINKIDDKKEPDQIRD